MILISRKFVVFLITAGILLPIVMSLWSLITSSHAVKQPGITRQNTNVVKLEPHAIKPDLKLPETVPMPAHPLDCEQGISDLDALWDRFTIVTAFSQNHVKEALGMIGSVQKYMPGKRIVVYDLGIRASTLPKIKELCDVEVRKFEFNKYPQHTKNLHTFAWKVFVIKETLYEFGAIFWGDASVRFNGSLKEVLPYLHLHHGFMTHIHSYDPKLPAPVRHQYYFIFPKMFEELGVNRTEYYNSHQSTPHLAANRLLFVNNSVINNNLLKPLVDCAMRQGCIAPEGARVGNHRFDAAALAVLAYKNMKREWNPSNRNTTSDILDNVATTKRITWDQKNAKTCKIH